MLNSYDPLAELWPGTTLIEASAGTGKTYTIAGIFLRAVVDEGLLPRDILVVTFTEAATAELRDRVRSRLSDALRAMNDGSTSDAFLRIPEDATLRAAKGDRIREALSTFDDAAILTIHGFCRRTLREYAFETGSSFDQELLSDPATLYEEIALDFWSRCLSDASLYLARGVVDSGTTPKAILAAISSAIEDPDLRVIPIAVNAPAIDPETFERAFRAAKALFLEHTSAIGAVLADQESMKKNMRPNVDRCMRAWGSLFSGPPHGALSPDESLQKFSAEELQKKMLKGKTAPSHPFLDAWDRLLREAQGLRSVVDLHVRNLRLGLVEHVRREAPLRLDRTRCETFSDWMVKLDRALSGPKGRPLAEALSDRYKMALVDEFQDTDPKQFRIFHTIFQGRGRLFLIGDQKQAIYSFRGADILAYRRAAKHHVDRSYSLSVNRRTEPLLLATLNRLFGRAKFPFSESEHGLQRVDPAPGAADRWTLRGAPVRPLKVHFLDGVRFDLGADPVTKGTLNDLIPDLVASDVARLLLSESQNDGAPWRPDQIAVLVRSNVQAKRMQRALERRLIPCVVSGAESVFESDEAFELSLILNALIDPSHARTVRAALSTRVINLPAERLLTESDAHVEALFEHMRRFASVFEQRGLDAAFRAMSAELDLPARLLAIHGGERILTNLLHMIEILTRDAREQRLSPRGVLDRLHRLRARGETIEDQVVRPEREVGALKVLTMHRSKGLEFDLVICPYLWDLAPRRTGDPRPARFHDPAADDALTLDIGDPPSDTSIRQERRETRDETFRLLYVAMTRARRGLWVYWANLKYAWETPLGALLHAGTGADGPGSAEQRTKDATSAQLLSDLRGLEGAISGFEVVLEEPPCDALVPESRSEVEIDPRELSRPIDRSFRIASFSSLNTTGHEKASVWKERDHDQIAPAEVTHEVSVLPRGAAFGTFLHEVMEHIDYQREDLHAARNLVDTLIAKHGFGGKELELPIYALVDRILTTQLFDGSQAFTLSEVRPEERLHELEFLFPIEAADRPFSREALSAACRGSSGAFPDSALEAVDGLDFSPFHGYLRGFVDMVFRHRGRYYLVDFKTNDLGADMESYRRERLTEPMSKGGYFLQYNLYLAALDRYLALRVPGYDRERQLGGVLYLFVRGMSPARGAAYGVFYDPAQRPALV